MGAAASSDIAVVLAADLDADYACAVARLPLDACICPQHALEILHGREHSKTPRRVERRPERWHAGPGEQT